MGDALIIDVRHDQGNAIVTAAGEIDISTVTRLRERLFELAASSRPLVVDLDQVKLHRLRRARRAGRHGQSRRRARRQRVRGLRPAEDPRVVPPGRAGLPDTAGPHPGRGPGGGPYHARLGPSPGSVSPAASNRVGSYSVLIPACEPADTRRSPAECRGRPLPLHSRAARPPHGARQVTACDFQR